MLVGATLNAAMRHTFSGAIVAISITLNGNINSVETAVYNACKTHSRSRCQQRYARLQCNTYVAATCAN
jgi:hypothetical protein